MSRCGHPTVAGSAMCATSTAVPAHTRSGSLELLVDARAAWSGFRMGWRCIPPWAPNGRRLTYTAFRENGEVGRSWCGAKRRRLLAWPASRRNSTRTLALDHGRSRAWSRASDADRRHRAPARRSWDPYQSHQRDTESAASPALTHPRQRHRLQVALSLRPGEAGAGGFVSQTPGRRPQRASRVRLRRHSQADRKRKRQG
jgi:hypothetical protein